MNDLKESVASSGADWFPRRSLSLYGALEAVAATVAMCISPALTNADAPQTISKIYWTSCCDISVHRANLDGTQAEAVFHTAGGGLPRFGFDTAERQIYFPSLVAADVKRADLDGAHAEVAIAGVNAYRVTIDSTNRKAYWTVSASPTQIWRADLDGGNRELLVDDITQVTGLVVDGEGGFFYWSDFFTGMIRRTTLDNSYTDILLDDSAFGRTPLPTGLALDPQGGYLYASDTVLGAIVRIGLDGSSPVKLITSGVVNPDSIAVDPTGQRVYWGNSTANFGTASEYSKYIMSAKLDGTDVRKEFLPLNLFGYPDTAVQLAIIQIPVPEPNLAIVSVFAVVALLFWRPRPKDTTANAKYMKQDEARRE